MKDNKTNLGRKSNTSTYEQRIPEAMEMILYEKLNATEFREKGAKRWGISERSAEDIYKVTKERIKARFEEKSDEIISEQLQRYFDLLTRCRESGNRRVEREVLADLNKLYGLEQKKIDITSAGQPVSININLND
jgi:hypothetical protein